MNDIFTFYGDKRNNIHLLLYFNLYDDKYDVLPGELPVVLEVKEHNIPINFVVNRCPKEITNNKANRKILLNQIKQSREESEYPFFKDNKTFCINCLSKEGFNELLKGIYNEYKDYLISDENIEKMQNNSITEEEFDKIYNDSYFFGKIKKEDVFLNESILNSAKDIKD
jgi:hypothetical protein